MLWKDGLFQNEMLYDGEINPDRAYPVLLNLLPAGLKGLSFAALTAAVVASLAGKSNSIATIFSLDVYHKIFDRKASEKAYSCWKITIIISMILAVIIAPILELTKRRFSIYPRVYRVCLSRIFAMFTLGFFWKTTSTAALFATIGGFFFSVFLKFLPGYTDLSFLSKYKFAILNKASGLYEIPFLDRMAIVFIICVIGMFLISKTENARGVIPKGLEVDSKCSESIRIFIGALIITLITTALYMIYW